MAGTANKSKPVVRSRRKSKASPITKSELVKKMLVDQKIIQEAREKGISYEELEKKYGFKFARLPHIQD